jgi:hypothetical protein
MAATLAPPCAPARARFLPHHVLLLDGGLETVVKYRIGAIQRRQAIAERILHDTQLRWRPALHVEGT